MSKKDVIKEKEEEFNLLVETLNSISEQVNELNQEFQRKKAQAIELQGELKGLKYSE